MKKYGDQISVEQVLKDDATGSGIPRKLHKAPKKDTVVVMDGAVTIIRLVHSLSVMVCLSVSL